jgi:serine/threonine-protein kinase
VVDHRTDLYAAGVVLFELLTGTRLYEAGPEPDYRALAKKVASGEHSLPSQIDPALRAYDDLVATALRPRAEDRYQSAAELRDAIQHCLVAVNPTISTDQLGAYMRTLFADEMTAQRELHERVASAHLADFQDQFQTQTISTISFAVAELPLQHPDATGRVGRRLATQPSTRSRSTGPNAMVGSGQHWPEGDVAGRRSSPALDAFAALAGSIEPREERHDPSDPSDPSDTIAMDGYMIGPRRRGLVIAASVAVAVLVGVGVWGFTTTYGASTPQPAAAPVSPVAAPSLPPAAPGPVAQSAIEIHEIAPEVPPPAVPLPEPNRRLGHDTPHRAPHKDTKPPSVAAPYALSREQLGQKFQQIRREYDSYKAKFGSRLEREWGEFATSIQYLTASGDEAGLREAGRKIDEFRGRVRE